MPDCSRLSRVVLEGVWDSAEPAPAVRGPRLRRLAPPGRGRESIAFVGVEAEPMVSNEGARAAGLGSGPNRGGGRPTTKSGESSNTTLESRGLSGKPRLLGPESSPDVPLLAVAIPEVCRSITDADASSTSASAEFDRAQDRPEMIVQKVPGSRVPRYPSSAKRSPHSQRSAFSSDSVSSRSSRIAARVCSGPNPR